jgi:hypothetical protein
VNLSKEQLAELNRLLNDESLDLPDIRRQVTPSGRNLVWLRKHFSTNADNVPTRLKLPSASDVLDSLQEYRCSSLARFHADKTKP